jgi:hypothetical protein
MKIYQIELLEPKAKKLLEELVNLKLIKVQELPAPKKEFAMLLSKIRNKNTKKITLADITKEVELVRKRRYGKNKN